MKKCKFLCKPKKKMQKKRQKKRQKYATWGKGDLCKNMQFMQLAYPPPPDYTPFTAREGAVSLWVVCCATLATLHASAGAPHSVWVGGSVLSPFGGGSPGLCWGYVLLLDRRKFPPPCLVPRAVVPPHATPCPLTEASEHLHPSLNLGKPVVGQACRGLQGHPLLLSRRVKALWDTWTSWKKLFKACAGTSAMMWLPPLARPHSSGLCAWTVRCPVSATPACSISNAMRAHGPTAGVGGPPTCTKAFPTLARRGFPPLAIRFCVWFGYDRPQTPRTIPCLFIHVAGLGLWCDSSALG